MNFLTHKQCSDINVRSCSKNHVLPLCFEVNVLFSCTVFAVRMYRVGVCTVCFCDPVFQHIGIVGLLLAHLESRERERKCKGASKKN